MNVSRYKRADGIQPVKNLPICRVTAGMTRRIRRRWKASVRELRRNETDRHMKSLHPVSQKMIVFMVILLVSAALLISLDQHGGFNPQCPICHSGHSFTGVAQVFANDFQLEFIEYCRPTEFVGKSPVFFRIIQNKSPPS